MSCRLNATSASRFTKCVCCGEQIRTCEPMTIVIDETTKRPVRGERYCPACADGGYPERNNVMTVSTESI